MLQRAITCFEGQSYPNRELIVVYEEDDAATKAFVAAKGHGNGSRISFVCVEAVPKRTLGELRNTGIEMAAGEFICQWDDDDWYHAGRLTCQYDQLQQNDRSGSVLTQWVVYDAMRKNAYVSNRRIWEGSILCRKSTIRLAPYENKAIGEDTATVERLVEAGHLHLINGRPGLYIYIYHGHNTWHFDHWNYIFQCSDQLPDKDAAHLAGILNGDYATVAGSKLMDEIMQRYYARKQVGTVEK
jgi:glycosyltransferase involved in cell wall biosynthesis